MKPEKLTFIGLKSYSEQVEIDFSLLTDGGLFGIFGSTGSGKSTILDAMFLALYGEFPESNVSTNDFINSKTGYLSVEFTFSIKSGGGEERYFVKREYKAKGTKKTVPQPKGVLYKIEGENKIPLSENATQTTLKVEEILGLKIDQFVKCIVVPQGQFSAFLSLNRGDRLKMMSGLFDLDKFGYKLQEKIKNDLGRILDEETLLEGKLSVFQEYTKEAYALCQEELNKAKDAYETENVKSVKIVEHFNEYKNNYDRHKKLKEKKLRLEVLAKSASQIDRLDKNLAKYASSKYALEIYNKINQLRMDNSALELDLKNKKLRLEELQNGYKLIEEEHLTIDEKDKQLFELKTTLAKIDALKIDLKKKAEIERQLEQERKAYKKIFNDKNLIDEKIANITLELNKLEERKNSLRISDRIDSLISSISLSSNQVLPCEIDFLNNLKPYVLLDKQQTVVDRIEELKSLLNENGESTSTFNELQTLLEENDKLNSDISKMLGNKNILLSEIKILQSKLDGSLENGKKLRQEIDDIESKIKDACGGVDYYVKTAQLNSQINALQNQISDINKRFNDYSKLIPEQKSQVEILIGKIETNEKQIELMTVDLSQKLNGMNIEQAKVIVDMISDPEEIKSRIEKYKLERNSLEDSIAELQNLVPENEYSQEILADLQLKTEEIDKNTKIFLENYIKLKKTLENISQKLEERCIIEKDYDILKKKKELYSQLLNSVRSSKLLEFVADEYLCDISFDANETLGILSNGKFGLRYDKEFLVVDYNNAVERKTSTASGGELFLVSLSLALSLSKSIIAKTNKPIEFFFLDEGFGSLDSALVETVIDSLERLRNESFTIGIISHVEALKERIATKVIVTEPKNGFGSRVKVTN